MNVTPTGLPPRGISGVYRIVNTISNKVYVGQAQDVNRRLCGHRSALRRGEHHNSHLQSAWNLYGESAFQFMLIKSCLIAELSQTEATEIAKVPPSSRYNIGDDCQVPARGHRHTEATKEGWRQSKIRHYAQPGTREAAGVTQKKRMEDVAERQQISNTLKRHFSNPESRVATSRAKGGRGVVGTHMLSGARVCFATLADARRSGFVPSNIANVANGGNRKQHRQYVWTWA